MEKLKRDIVIRFNAYEAGCLLGLLMREKPKWATKIISQLLAIKKDIEKACGVTKELLPNGKVKVTHDDGIVITRPMFPWEEGTFVNGA